MDTYQVWLKLRCPEREMLCKKGPFHLAMNDWCNIRATRHPHTAVSMTRATKGFTLKRRRRRPGGQGGGGAQSQGVVIHLEGSLCTTRPGVKNIFQIFGVKSVAKIIWAMTLWLDSINSSPIYVYIWAQTSLPDLYFVWWAKDCQFQSCLGASIKSIQRFWTTKLFQ